MAIEYIRLEHRGDVVVVVVVVVQSLSRVQFFATPGTEASRFACSSPCPGVCSNSCWERLKAGGEGDDRG